MLIISYLDKLTESLKDYRASIEKLQLASKQRHAKMKKKVNNCVAVLSMIDSSLFGSDVTFGQFIKSLSQPETKKAAAPTESTEASPEPAATEEAFEFDEKKFIDLVDKKRHEMESSKETERLREEIESVKQELESTQAKLIRAEAKIKEEKDKLAADQQREVDELQLKLANLDLKYKQMQLDENRELHTAKKKLSTLEDELNKSKRENEQLTAQLKSEGEANEKSLQSVKQKAELKMASIKVS